MFRRCQTRPVLRHGKAHCCLRSPFVQARALGRVQHRNKVFFFLFSHASMSNIYPRTHFPPFPPFWLHLSGSWLLLTRARSPSPLELLLPTRQKVWPLHNVSVSFSHYFIWHHDALPYDVCVCYEERGTAQCRTATFAHVTFSDGTHAPSSN